LSTPALSALSPSDRSERDIYNRKNLREREKEGERKWERGGERDKEIKRGWERGRARERERDRVRKIERKREM
jgi:hypothetical protein